MWAPLWFPEHAYGGGVNIAREQINLYFWGGARDEERLRIGAGGVAKQKQPTENVSENVLCAWMARGIWQKWVLKDGVCPRDGGNGSLNEDAARGWMWLSELRVLRQTE